jgi:two-component system chemotaxis response regulator CheB
MSPVRVLVVDDSAFMRRRLTSIIESAPDLMVTGIARDGEEAIERVRELEPDVLTLDINMPRMDGLTALTYIMMERPTPTVIVSSLTQEGAITTLEALELGAVDFVPKPSGTVSMDIERQQAEIVEKVRTAARARLGRRRSAATLRRQAGVGRYAAVAAAAAEESETPTRPARTTRLAQTSRASSHRSDRAARHSGPARGIIAIGVSTGGPQTLLEVLPLLPADLPLPVVLVQHMPAHFTSAFAARLNGECAITVKEAEHNEALQAGTAYVAPGGFQMTVAESITGGSGRVRLSDRPRGMTFCPSADVLFESVARTYGDSAIGVLLTGMGDDGADGMVLIRQAGGATIAESQETAIVYGMPRAAIERGGAADVLPVQQVTARILAILEEHRP